MTTFFRRLNGDEQLPLFRTWTGWYSAVLVNLVFWLVLFYLFRKIFE